MIRIALAVVALMSLPGLAGCAWWEEAKDSVLIAPLSETLEAFDGAAAQHQRDAVLHDYGGLYDDPDLADYVTDLGQALLAAAGGTTDRYTFAVLNDARAEAFALGDGSVFVTRGLLALAVGDGDVAAALARALAAAPVAEVGPPDNLGLRVLAALDQEGDAAPSVLDAAGAADQPAETGDQRAAAMLSAAGHDPLALLALASRMDAYARLDAEAADDGATVRGPDEAAAAGDDAAAPAAADRDAYLARIDGLMFGDDPALGTRRGRYYVHPDRRIRVKVPPGFGVARLARGIAAEGPEGSAMAFDWLDARAAGETLGLVAYLKTRWGRKLTLQDVERIRVNDMEAATGRSYLITRQGRMDLRLVVVRDPEDRIYRLLFVTPPAVTGLLTAEMQRTTYSIRRLSLAEAAAVKPLRIRVVAKAVGETPADLAARMAVPAHRRAWFELLNGIAPGQALAPGRRVKVVAD